MNKIEDYQLHLYFGKDEVNTVNNGELLSILNAQEGHVMLKINLIQIYMNY